MGALADAQVDEATDEETMLKTKGNATHRLIMNSHKNKNRENQYLCLGSLTSDCVLKVIKEKKERKQQWLREKKRGGSSRRLESTENFTSTFRRMWR